MHSKFIFILLTAIVFNSASAFSFEFSNLQVSPILIKAGLYLEVKFPSVNRLEIFTTDNPDRIEVTYSRAPKSWKYKLKCLSTDTLTTCRTGVLVDPCQERDHLEIKWISETKIEVTKQVCTYDEPTWRTVYNGVMQLQQ